jgi:hypothetical protein
MVLEKHRVQGEDREADLEELGQDFETCWLTRMGQDSARPWMFAEILARVQIEHLPMGSWQLNH